MTKKIISGVLAVALAGSFMTAVSVEQVEAAQKRKTLLEALFPQAAKKAKQRRLRQQQRLQQQRGLVPLAREQEQRNIDPIPKVKGPSYYAYRTEKFRKVQFAKIANAIVAAEEARKPRALDVPENHSDDPGYFLDSTTLDTVTTGSTGNGGEGAVMLKTDILRNISLQAESEIADVVEKHYSGHPSFIWIGSGLKPTAKAQAALFALNHAEDYGLSSNDYEVETVKSMMERGISKEEAATRFETAMTTSVLRYMADADRGVINPNRISGYHDFSSYKRNYSDHLNAVLSAEYPVKAMFAAHPKNAQFKAMRKELKALNVQKDKIQLEPIAKGTFIRPGQVNDELPKVVAAISARGSDELKEKHSDLLASYSGSNAYQDELVELVRDFQKEANLKPDGIIGKNTIFKMTGDGPQARIAKLRLAMERLRWHPEELGSRHVFINQPAYNASYMVNGRPNLSMKVIVGKNSNQTSFFHDTIEIVEFNPYWNVPRSILVNEKLRRLQSDPYYYQRRGYEVVKHGGRVVDPGQVNWYSEKSTKKYYVRQKPGRNNALGELKILFPNKHSIYMHDTPSRGLFKRSNRALSHGCVRLHKPRDMAAAVLGTSVEKVGNYIASGKNRALPVDNKIPVYVAYFTAWPKASGEISYYPDIYGRDKYLERALSKTSEVRKSALSS